MIQATEEHPRERSALDPELSARCFAVRQTLKLVCINPQRHHTRRHAGGKRWEGMVVLVLGGKVDGRCAPQRRVFEQRVIEVLEEPVSTSNVGIQCSVRADDVRYSVESRQPGRYQSMKEVKGMYMDDIHGWNQPAQDPPHL